MSIGKLDSLLKKIDKLEDIPGGVLRVNVSRQIQKVNGYARDNCPTYDGELRNSIHAYSEVTGDGVRGICYTTKKYAPYVELGAGPKGEADHKGISPAITPSYTQQPWFVHESQLGRAAEVYRWPSINTPDGRFYICSGQPAHPYMYPALKNNENRIMQELGDDLKKEIKKV